MNAEVGKSEQELDQAEAEETETRPDAPADPETSSSQDEAAGADDAPARDEPELLKERLMEMETKRLEAERQVQDYADRFRQAQAQLRRETDELRGRLQRNFEQKIDAARGDIVASLIETLDNLKRAVAVAETGKGREADFNALLDGVRATAELFETRMKALGLATLASEGEEFNPELHEAVEIVPVEPERDNLVIAELQPGYKFGDRLLRPARVRVGRAKSIN
jgi:molecular chaperone GrpE